MHRRGRIILLGLLACLAAFAVAPAAGADGGKVIKVKPGESIQAAIDKAKPGDTIKVARGTFHENVAITTNHITLRGAGPGKHGTVLKPPAEPVANICSFEDEEGNLIVDGICVAGAFDPDTFELGDPVVGTKIKGFHVKRFPGFGVILINAKRSTVELVQASHNEGYGISGFGLSGIKLLHNYSHDNVEPGFYVGDSPNARAVIIGNRADHNQMGIFLRDASKGLVRHNKVKDNCAGIVILETGAPDPAADWRLKQNLVRHNNEACPGHPEEGEDPLSGIGIALAGADRVLVKNNLVLGNRPSGESLISGGIVVFSTADPSIGGDDPNDNLIKKNVAFRNDPADIFWDETGTGNEFLRNRCGTSIPEVICD
jgi:parallel beta-helix repeat protein